MRNLAAALAIALVTALGIASPAAAVQTSTAKVVIVVGATHGATAGYRANADAAYAEAIKYTSHVTKVYSPSATWTKVKAAAKGANILIYFGHGNGWPSPYTFDPKYTTKDGMGLNADLNGDGKLSDYENHYYGEPSVATLDLAPNAIVFLHHLCYASGNSESSSNNPSPIASPAPRVTRRMGRPCTVFSIETAPEARIAMNVRGAPSSKSTASHSYVTVETIRES